MIYAISLDLQKDELDAYCFNCDVCGHISLGGININGYSFFPCCQDKCEFEERKSSVIGQALDDDVCIRKLKPYNNGMHRDLA